MLKAFRKVRISFKAFTLMELLVTVVIVGLIAAFAIPNYSKGVERSYRKMGEDNLHTIWAAEQTYYNANGHTYWPGVSLPFQDINAINTNLGLKLIANGFLYQCTSGSVADFSCYAYRPETGPARFFLTITEAPISGANPSCTDGSSTCP